ncbi:kinase-like domain-containing protein [Glomus cerebriforme]|uniref:Kinase-like domain-containing protein n=1 Tax=Glomus cerebriforme TaxID=658196 RepID=A0A397TAF4_9GLOM|nr:kinase-like domain-containing protein [Glomus cerebriforme]
MELINANSKFEEKPKNSWKCFDYGEYQGHVSLFDSSITESEKIGKVIYVDDLEKRKQVYGICGECKQPGTGEWWCHPCNSERFKNNFNNWTSGNKDIDEFIQQSQLNAFYHKTVLEWVPFENFQKINYLTSGGFGKIYSAIWTEGHITFWNIENQKWKRRSKEKVALKSLDNSSDISTEFLNEIKSHLQVHLYDVIQCHGITQDPDTKDYMMILDFCEDGNLRNYLNKNYVGYESKIQKLFGISRGLLDIHNAGKVHKDFHSGNILFGYDNPYISDLGMCQPANVKAQREGIYGVLPYMAPEVIRGHHYEKAADIYSFGIMMNEFISEEIPYNDIPHDDFLAIKICKGLRPNISQETPKLLSDLIIKCWDAKIENRPTTKELCQILKRWSNSDYSKDGKDGNEIYSQIENFDKISLKKFNNRTKKNNSKNIRTHPQAIYTSRLLNFKDLPKPVNSSNIQLNLVDTDYAIQSAFENPIVSECLDVQLSELDLNEIDEDDD